MVNKGKLKMALVAEKQVDFKKEHQKKLAKQARKEHKKKAPAPVEEDIEMDDAEEDSEEEDEEGLAELMAMEQDEESDEEEERAQINLANIDDSDSASSSGVSDGNGLDSDDEDIPLSDLEDLDDEDKEDMIPHQRLTINNTTALTTALRRIALPLKSFQFVDHQSVTTSAPVIIEDVSDDLTRELEFYKQSLSAVQEARTLLKKEKQPFSRPTDYFAEMVKADEHMAKIKAKLVEAAASKKASAEARKQRDLKKFGKQVQVQKLQERQKEKTATLEKIKTLKRSEFCHPYFSFEEAATNTHPRASRRRSHRRRNRSRPLRRRARQRDQARRPQVPRRRPLPEAQQARG